MGRAGILSEQQVGHPGCGRGTPNACFALSFGPDGWECLLVTKPQMAGMVGIGLGWRVNVDPNDRKAWCPLGVLNNSKVLGARP
jgi:hypothetical protein